MGYNIYQGQIVGPFRNEENLGTLIRKQCIDITGKNAILWHLGIQAETNSKFNIDGKQTVIGKTGIYEIGNLDINLDTLTFQPLQNLPVGTIIDYVVTIK